MKGEWQQRFYVNGDVRVEPGRQQHDARARSAPVVERRGPQAGGRGSSIIWLSPHGVSQGGDGGQGRVCRDAHARGTVRRRS